MLPSASAPSPEGATSGAARFLAGGTALGGATGGAGPARAAFAAGRRAPCSAGLFGLRGRSDSGRSSSLSLAVPVTGSERWARRGVPKNARGWGGFGVCASARRVRGARVRVAARSCNDAGARASGFTRGVASQTLRVEMHSTRPRRPPLGGSCGPGLSPQRPRGYSTELSRTCGGAPPSCPAARRLENSLAIVLSPTSNPSWAPKVAPACRGRLFTPCSRPFAAKRNRTCCIAWREPGRATTST